MLPATSAALLYLTRDECGVNDGGGGGGWGRGAAASSRISEFVSWQPAVSGGNLIAYLLDLLLGDAIVSLSVSKNSPQGVDAVVGGGKGGGERVDANGQLCVLADVENDRRSTTERCNQPVVAREITSKHGVVVDAVWWKHMPPLAGSGSEKRRV